MFVCQRWHSKFPRSIRWVPTLFDGGSIRAVLRLLLVFLCVLIMLLMAVLNIVSQQLHTETHPHKHQLVTGRPDKRVKADKTTKADYTPQIDVCNAVYSFKLEERKQPEYTFKCIIMLFKYCDTYFYTYRRYP